jgi:hypothetical protein
MLDRAGYYRAATAIEVDRDGACDATRYIVAASSVFSTQMAAHPDRRLVKRAIELLHGTEWRHG